jgi:hypothetical protein
MLMFGLWCVFLDTNCGEENIRNHFSTAICCCFRVLLGVGEVRVFVFVCVGLWGSGIVGNENVSGFQEE